MATLDYTDEAPARLEVDFAFAAAHRLPRYDGPCFRMHGHNYQLRVCLEGTVAPATGMMADFTAIQALVQQHVMSHVDHQCLNDLLDNPTAENIARWTWETLAPHLTGLVEVRLWEIPGCCVVYRGQRAKAGGRP